MLNDQELFFDHRSGLDTLMECFHGTGRTPSDEELVSFFHQLPEDIQDGARSWSLSDTPVRDNLCVWTQENRHRLATLDLRPRPAWKDVLIARNGAKAEAVVDAAVALGYPFVLLQNRLYRVIGQDVQDTGSTVEDVH